MGKEKHKKGDKNRRLETIVLITAKIPFFLPIVNINS